MNALTFNQITFNPVELQDGQIWLTSSELAQALGYKFADSVTKIYNRNSDEFTENMTQVIDLSRDGQIDRQGEIKGLQKKTRIFSLRGCHLVAMFAKTEIAKSFRKWVLDVLDNVVMADKKEARLSTVKDREALNSAIKRLAKMANIDYSTAYKMVWERHGIKNADSLPVEMIPEVLEYVHGLILKAAAAKEEPVKKERISPKEMTNLRHLVSEIIRSFFCDETARMAIWYRLRKITGVESPERFYREDMPTIRKEAERLLLLSHTICELRYEFDQAAIKEIIREGKEQTKILEDLREQYLQGLADYQSNTLAAYERRLLEALA